MLNIAVDYHDTRNEFPTFVISEGRDFGIKIIETGYIKDLDISKYGEEFTYYGRVEDVERFKREFNL